MVEFDKGRKANENVSCKYHNYLTNKKVLIDRRRGTEKHSHAPCIEIFFKYLVVIFCKFQLNLYIKNEYERLMSIIKRLFHK